MLAFVRSEAVRPVGFAPWPRATTAADPCAERPPTQASRLVGAAGSSDYLAAGLGGLTRRPSVPGGPAPVKEQHPPERLQATGALSSPKPSCSARTASS